MQDFNPWNEALKASYSLIAAVIVLALGWLIGQRLTFAWSIRQKRREFQLSASQQFYSAYGEFFAVWKLWNKLDCAVETYDGRRWELYKRAASAEATIEGTFVKLSSEVTLSDDQVKMLGCFRQAFQQLRESIRDSRPLPWNNSEHTGYRVFKSLAVRVAALLGAEWPFNIPSGERASEQLIKITSNEWMSSWAS